MKFFFLLLIAFPALFSFPLQLLASETTAIAPGKDYKKYSHEELQKRVWQLEKAVQELQEISKKQAEQTTAIIETAKAKEKAASTQWTCYIRTTSFFVSTDPTKELATKNALEKCRTNGPAMHCKESYVKCEEEHTEVQP